MESAKIIVGITGASGSIYGIRLLEELKTLGIESHLVISKIGALNISIETDYKLSDIHNLASKVYNVNDITAPIASGSFKTLGMVIAPCSVKTMSAIATGHADNLIARAADVVLKERRKLVMMVRETPLNLVHLRNMATLTEMGAIIAPPMPAFYNKPQSLDDIVNHSVGRILDLFDIESNLVKRWCGIK
jgi:4-hydroxy-3-polyprenylbenzoate decarboxylase